MQKGIAVILYLLMTVSLFSQEMPLMKISILDLSDHASIQIESSEPLSYSVEKAGEYLMIRLRTEETFRIRKSSFASDFVESIGWSRRNGHYLISIQAARSDFHFEHSYVKNPSLLVVDLGWSDSGQWGNTPAESNLPENRPGLDGNETPSRAQPQRGSRRTIVIDPGHGGMEIGAQGKSGVQEKIVTLDIALKLREVIERNLAYRVVMTREDDRDVSLDNRAAIANNNQAYVFISIHANGFFKKSAHGSESYFLSLNATDEEARRLAYLENNSSEINQIKGVDNEDDIKMILWDMAQSAYLQQSSDLAERIQEELNLLLGTKNRGIKQAPFKVLTGVACPAVLVEVAFLSNPDEEKKLMDEEFQMNVARAIYRGLVDFLDSYSGH